MSVTTSTRLGITRWSAGSDPFTRAHMDGSHSLLDDLVAIHKAGTLAARPAAAAANVGTYYYATDTADLYFSTGAAWRKVDLDGDVTLRFAWTFSLPGEVKVPSGSTDVLPYVPISVPAGQAVTLIGYQWTILGGTSFTFSMKHKTGATLATNTDLVTGVVAAASSVKGAGTYGTPKTCADGDAWHPVVTAVSSTPVNASVAMIADVTF